MRTVYRLSSTVLLAAALTSSARAQDTRQTVEQMQSRFERIRFTPPTPHMVRLRNGVQVFMLEDHSLPQLQLNIVGRHGVANLPIRCLRPGGRPTA